MTQRDAQFFVQGMQFAAAAKGISDAQVILLTVLAAEVVEALGVKVNEMIALTPEIHKALDIGGFRGEEAQRRARQ